MVLSCNVRKGRGREGGEERGETERGRGREEEKRDIPVKCLKSRLTRLCNVEESYRAAVTSYVI